MIRNYYTDSFKGGRSVTPSDLLLIDGRAVIAASSTSATGGAVAIGTKRLILTARPASPILRNMEVTAAPGTVGIPVSGNANYPLIIANNNILSSTTSSDNTASVVSATIAIATANPLVKVGMEVAGNGIVGKPVILTVNGASNSFTVNVAQSIAVNTVLTYSGIGYEYDFNNDVTGIIPAAAALTFISINQSSWEEYNLYIGTSPGDASLAPQAQGKTTGVSAAGATSFLIDIPDPNIQVGMLVTDTTNSDIPVGAVVAAVTNNGRQISIAPSQIVAGGMPAASIVNFSFQNHATLRVRTIDNSILTFENPSQGQILPVSVVQVFSAGTSNGTSNLIALK